MAAFLGIEVAFDNVSTNAIIQALRDLGLAEWSAQAQNHSGIRSRLGL